MICAELPVGAKCLLTSKFAHSWHICVLVAKCFLTSTHARLIRVYVFSMTILCIVVSCFICIVLFIFLKLCNIQSVERWYCWQCIGNGFPWFWFFLFPPLVCPKISLFKVNLSVIWRDDYVVKYYRFSFLLILNIHVWIIVALHCSSKIRNKQDCNRQTFAKTSAIWLASLNSWENFTHWKQRYRFCAL
jgi:hypothetical protein